MTKKQLWHMMLLLIIPYSLLIQLAILPLFPQKYFYDSNFILKSINGVVYVDIDPAYSFCKNLFGAIGEYLNISTMGQWSVVITSIFSVLFIFLMIKYADVSVFQVLFVYMSLALLNIYVFRIGKDIIQLTINLICCCIINSRANINTRVILSALVLAIEGLFFRSYFLLTALLILLINFLMRSPKAFNFKITGKRALAMIFCCIAGLMCLKIYFPEHYFKIITARFSVNVNRLGSGDAQTIVNNIFPQVNGSILMFILNYTVNAIRFLVPLELLRISIVYLPFIIYQLIITHKISESIISYYKNSEQCSSKKFLVLSFIIAYLLVSFIFEPDFGSFLRHESVLTPMFFALLMKEKKVRLLL